MTSNEVVSIPDAFQKVGGEGHLHTHDGTKQGREARAEPLPQWGPALSAPRNGVVIDEFPQHQAHHFHGNARAAVLQHLPGARVSDTHQNGTMLEGYNRVKIGVFAPSLSKSYGVWNDMI